MPNIKSAKKRVKTIAIRTQKNAALKSSVKTAIKRFEEAVSSGNQEKANDALLKAIKKVDKAAARGMFHENKAARKVAQLQKAFNAMVKNAS